MRLKQGESMSDTKKTFETTQTKGPLETTTANREGHIDLGEKIDARVVISTPLPSIVVSPVASQPNTPAPTAGQTPQAQAPSGQYNGSSPDKK
jgi:hypothetical protein